MMKKLNDTESKNPFRVPENYFEDMTRKIMSVAAGTKPGAERRGLYRRLRPILAAAATVAAFILLSYTAMKIFLPDTGNSLPQISMEEFSEFYLNDIDILTLEKNTDPSFLNEGSADLTKSEIIDYLLVENIDLNEIYELL